MPAARYPHRRGSAPEHEVRRLRDLLRAAILRHAYPDGQLPGEAALMAGHKVGRAVVRQALGLLRSEGLIARTQGVGTYVVVDAVMTQLSEAHGAGTPTQESIFNRRMRPRVLDVSTIPAPDTVAARLEVAPGTPCLRLDYIALLGEEPGAIATNYVLFPYAERIRVTPFVSDWYALLADAGIAFGESEFVISCSLADEVTAPAVGVGVGAPLLTMEQLIRDCDGQAFDLAFIHTRGDRFLFLSRAGRA
ncbi:GntR family transcriptional regulator [Actinopolymorpha sp. NPDC004070]|uniref:GntR family transcriptional regulator n=1 Tax=Actinopolymorpha sp. NPDC004070 TaxID=3154548 RepID=UPI00339F7751